MNEIYKVSLVLAVVGTFLVGCGQNSAEDSNAQSEVITGTPAALQAGQYTNYGTSAINGQVSNVGTSYFPCPNQVNQICSQQTARACSGTTTNIFGQQVSQCNSQFGVNTQINVVQVRRVMTRYVIPVTQTQTVQCATGNCIASPSNVQQVQYGSDMQCANENVVLGSLKFNVGTYQNTNSQFITLNWNDYKGTDTPIQYYRVVIYGDHDMTPALSWVSQKIFANPLSTTVSTIIDSNSLGSFENISFGGLNQISSEGRTLGQRVPWVRNENYWYKVIAFTADATPALGHLNQVLHRPFDIKLIDCTPTTIAGFCSFH